ncbi:MAG: AlpA family phage regulatory protein [Magnetococcales bacterium]|nr:AlpA family phage regulatory protein [Magnetococcales bacterium]
MNTRIIRRPEVQNRTGLSRSSIYLKISRGEFPAPIRLAWVSDG